MTTWADPNEQIMEDSRVTQSSILNTDHANEIATEVISQLEDAGYPVEESIPGLVVAIVRLAGQSSSEFIRESLLDAAANLLADVDDEGGID